MTIVDRSPAQTEPAQRTGRDRLAEAVAVAVDRIPLLLFWAALVVSVAILFDAFHRLLVLPALLLVVVATWQLTPRHLPPTRAVVVGAGLALLGTLVWLACQVPFSSAYVIVNRDPGFVTLEGLWLSDHPGSTIPVGSAEAVANAIDGVEASTGAYALIDGVLHPQGAKMLPGLLALATWFAGDRAALAGNLAIGAVGLLAVYGFGRRLVGPLWALLPMVALGASMPMAAFSRAAYTEPLNLALVFTGLTMLWSAIETRSWWRYLIGGSLIGSTVLARIDGSSSVIGLVAGLGISAAVVLAPRLRRRATLLSLVALGGAFAGTALGYLDLYLHSRRYLQDLSSQVTSLLVVLAATTVLVTVLVLLPSQGPRRWLLKHRKPIAGAIAGCVGAFTLALLTRPLWGVARGQQLGTSYSDLTAGLQAREGLTVDGTRSYDEMATAWLSWYQGWPAVLLGFAGLALVGYLAVRRRDGRLFVFLAVVAAPSALYLWKIAITPDQIWAMRRLLPVTIPGFLLAGTYALAAAERWGWRRFRTDRSRANVDVVVALLTSTVVVAPFMTWGPMFTQVEHDGRWGELATACAQIESDRVVYIREGGPPYLASLRSVCDVEVVEVRGEPTPEQLARIREEWGGQDLTLIAFDKTLVDWSEPTASVRHVRRTRVVNWDNALSYRPRSVVERVSEMYAGTIREDGLVEPRR